MTENAFLPATTHVYLERAAGSLAESIASSDPATRYSCAHVAALRSAAALLAARSRPGSSRRRRNAWVLLADTAPDLADWAAFFSSGAAKRAAAEAGATRAVSAAEADELIASADRFLAVVEESLGLVAHPSVVARVRDAV